MRYIDEFRDKKLIHLAASKIRGMMPKGHISLMEVCGTHTQSFYRFGLDKILPSHLRLISGPGCPVCVSSQEYIDSAIELARHKDVVVLTFGDMLRIPGTRSTLERARAKSGNVRILYSALDALKVAAQNPDKKIVFLGVGFETTAPTIALSILLAKRKKLSNLCFLTSLKLIPPAMDFLAKDKRLALNGFLCPGHVSAIIGTKPYASIAKRYKIGCCVAGFEPLDILEGIYLLLRQIRENRHQVENQYMRVVTKSGNQKAQDIIRQVFNLTDASWRGLGRIPKSGLEIKKGFAGFDAGKIFVLEHKKRQAGRPTQCRCGDVLRGLVSPKGCPLFSRTCSPDNPVGPCMVSYEGACNAYYRYRK